VGTPYQDLHKTGYVFNATPARFGCGELSVALGDALNDTTLNGWLMLPIGNLVDFLGGEMVIAGLTERSIFTAAGLPGILTSAYQHIPESNQRARKGIQKLIEITSQNVPFAKEERDQDFQRIRTHHVVATWAAIETTVEQLLVNLILRVHDAETRIRTLYPDIKLKPAQMKASPVGAKRALQAWEPWLFSKKTTERQVEMLKAFGLDVQLDDRSHRPLSEMAALRNVIVHNAGFVDQRFLDACDWRLESVGDRIHLDTVTMGAYFDAAIDFASNLSRAVMASDFMQTKTSGSS
jgi:hypothetical protein